ncbi:hypothetical protein SLA2020_364340 [Shorea laevis]
MSSPISSSQEPSSMVAEVNMGTDPCSPVIRATVVQASSVFYDTPATMDKAERLIADAAGLGSQLVVFPEGFIAIAVPGPEVERLAALAGKYKIYLVMGVIEKDEYTLYCTVLFFDSQGCYLGKHRKIMPTALERLVWGFGDASTTPVFETPIGKIGSVICWENRMPLLRTAMYAKGIEIYCAPTADCSDTWQATMNHIALEGGCFVLSAIQFCQRKDYPPPPEYTLSGTDDDLSPDSVACRGGSVIISPLGTVLAGPNHEGEGLLTADLDLGEIARAKFDFDVVGHYSRPDLLSLVVKDDPLSPVTFKSGKSEKLKQEPCWINKAQF